MNGESEKGNERWNEEVEYWDEKMVEVDSLVPSRARVERKESSSRKGFTVGRETSRKFDLFSSECSKCDKDLY